MVSLLVEFIHIKDFVPILGGVFEIFSFAFNQSHDAVLRKSQWHFSAPDYSDVVFVVVFI